MEAIRNLIMTQGVLLRWGIVVAFVVILFVLVGKTGFGDIFSPYYWMEKKKKKAKKAGHYVVGKLVDYNWHWDRDDHEKEYNCQYQYEFNGETRIHKVHYDGNNDPYETIEIYYDAEKNEIIERKGYYGCLTLLFALPLLACKCAPLIAGYYIAKFLGLF